jgi:IMP cyclohydrolase
MMNPNGPYPGRQLFIGMTMNGNPAVVYLVTGRSRPAGKERQHPAITELSSDRSGINRMTR